MTTRILCLFLLAAGCGTDPSGTDGDDDGGGGGGGGSGSGSMETTIEGRYGIQNQFDLATNMPGTAGTVASYIIDATDSGNDPTQFVVDLLIDQLPDGTVKTILRNAAPFVTGYVNERLLRITPIDRIVRVGDAFGQMAKGFGTHDTLEIDAAGRASKLVDGLHFKVDAMELDLPFAQFQVPATRVDGLTVTLEKSGRVLVSEHKFTLKYGQILKLALDQGIIPAVDPTSHNLGELLRHTINCKKVGEWVAEALGFGSASTFEGACNTGLEAAAGALYAKLAEIDGSALELTLTGSSFGYDRTNDHRVDTITSGVWTGGISYAGTPAQLSTATFTGSRL